MINQNAIANREQIASIRKRMINNEITYDEAAELAAPIIKRINNSGKAIAKKYGKRPQTVNFAALMR